jgi:hypothetical protein
VEFLIDDVAVFAKLEKMRKERESGLGRAILLGGIHVTVILFDLISFQFPVYPILFRD